jgi:hypothetical protein
MKKRLFLDSGLEDSEARVLQDRIANAVESILREYDSCHSADVAMCAMWGSYSAVLSNNLRCRGL